MSRNRIVFPPNNPEGTCIKCGGENIRFEYHARGILYQSYPLPPCYHYTANQDALEIEPIGEHLCKRCETCGFPWMEEVEPGPDYQVVVVQDDEMYPDEEREGGEMTLRKTGSATGEITGIDQNTSGLTKEAAAAAPWDDKDERALAGENIAADQDDPEPWPGT